MDQALAKVRGSELGAQQISIIVLLDGGGGLAGTVSLAELVGARPEQPLSELVKGSTPAVSTDADLPDVALLMTDYNLIAMPVLDADGHPAGIVSVDDVLELLVPEEWRRRAGLARS